MAKAAKQLQVKGGKVTDLFSKSESAITISETHTEELVIALCGPIGSPLHEVASAIGQMLFDTFGYDHCKQIRLSQFIQEHAYRVEREIPRSGFEKIEAQIETGNKLREQYGPSILADFAVNAIRVDRQKHKEEMGHETYAPRRICHIIDSIKNQEELDLLRMVYREMLYVVGVFSPLEQREENLKRRGLDSGEVYQLIDRDSGEESENGQTVRDTFPQSELIPGLILSWQGWLKDFCILSLALRSSPQHLMNPQCMPLHLPQRIPPAYHDRSALL
jgi:hypothetical protein